MSGMSGRALHGATNSDGLVNNALMMLSVEEALPASFIPQQMEVWSILEMGCHSIRMHAVVKKC